MKDLLKIDRKRVYVRLVSGTSKIFKVRVYGFFDFGITVHLFHIALALRLKNVFSEKIYFEYEI